MIFTPCLILSLLVVCRARFDEYRAVRNAVEEVLDVSFSPPCPSNGTEFQELILSSSKGNTTLIYLKRIFLKTGKATTAQRGCRVYGADDRPGPPLQSHIRPLLPGLRKDFDTFASQTRWLLNKWLIRWPWNPACLKASWGRLWTGASFSRQLCENLQGELLTFKSFYLYVEFRNSEAHQELVDKIQLIQEALTEKREE